MSEIENLPAPSNGGTDTTSESSSPKETARSIAPEGGKDVTPKAGEADKPADKLSVAMQKLARQEAQVRQERQAAKKEVEEARAQSKQLESTLAETKAKLAELNEREEHFRELMEGDPIAAMQALKIDFEQLVERIAGHGSPEMTAKSLKREFERQLESRMKGFEEKLTAREKAEQDAKDQAETEKKNYDLAVRRKACADKVLEESDRYPTLSLEDGPKIAFLIEDKALAKFEEYGEAAFTFDEIAQEVENELAAYEAERQGRRAKRTPGQQSSASATSGSPAKTDSPDGSGRDDSGAADDLVKAAQSRRAAAKTAKKPKSLTNKDAGQSVTWRKREESRHERALRAGKLISDG